MAKFTALEKDALDAPVKDIEWEGEEVGYQGKHNLQLDGGTGQAIILRFFDFVANPELFKTRKPTAQELFNTHNKGVQSLLWMDGLKPYEGIEPRLMFSKDKKNYRFVIACIPKEALIDKTKTLSELLTTQK